MNGAGRKDGGGVESGDGRTGRSVFCGVVERVWGVGSEGRCEGRIGRRWAARRGGRVVDVELHVIWVESAVVVRRREECAWLRDIGEVRMASCGEGGNGELVLWAAELVQDDDVHLFKVLYECVEIVYLEAAARVVATLG